MRITSLLVLPFAHEDLAIILGGYIVVNDLMPVGLVAVSIYCGMVGSDFALYGIGAAARRLPWLRRFAVDERVTRFGDTLKRNVFGLVALCRVVPGVVFVAFVACGWTRVSLARFTVASLVISALYLPLMLYLVIVFGDALDDHVGLWTWPMLLIAISASSFVRKRVFAFRAASEPDAADDAVLPAASFGMPPLASADRRVAAAERIPPALFYVPLVLNWLRLGLRHRSLTLPTAANPKFFTGGMWGESKSSYFFDVDPAMRRWIADFAVVERSAVAGGLAGDIDHALRALGEAGLDYPLVAKPDIGWHGHGVRRIDDGAALENYIASYPGGARLILQRFVPYPGEAAVLYARLPEEPAGRILSLTFRYFPHVVGNGRLTVRQLIRNDERAQWKSSLHRGVDRTHRGVDPRDLDCVPARSTATATAISPRRCRRASMRSPAA